MNALLSHLPDAIVYVSHEGARQHEHLGFPAAKTVVIPNGFDCTVMKPDDQAPVRLRGELGLAPDRAIVGMVTRAHPMKDHANLIRAVGILVGRSVDVHLVMVGRGVDPPDGPIAREVARAGLRERATLLGERDDIQRVLAGLDVLAVSSAWGESFPLIVGDAMASGVPCVVTDIGDCPALVGDTGIVVPRRDSEGLAAVIERLIALGPEARRRLGVAARARIQDTYSVERTTQQYEQLYQTLIEQELPRPVATNGRVVAPSISTGGRPVD
jgi:glycosyltransferase involved in cell wall biosynthesis